MAVNWNELNNRLSRAVLGAGLLGPLLEALGCEEGACSDGLDYRGPCPVHRGDGKNFRVSQEGHELPVYWQCFSHRCHERLKPSLLVLVRGALSEDPDSPVPLPEARRFLEDFLRRPGERPAAARPRLPRRPPQRPLSLTREQVRARLEIPSPYFVGRGYDPAVLDALDVGHSPRLGRSVVPVYDDLGERCVGVLSRAEHPACGRCRRHHTGEGGCGRGQERWLVQAGFERGQWLYNYLAAQQHRGRAVLLVEGPCDAFRAAEAGACAVALLGSDLLEAQVAKLALLRKDVVVAFDNDGPGRAAAASAAVILGRAGVRAEVRHPPEAYKDLGEMPAAEVTNWLSGRLAA